MNAWPGDKTPTGVLEAEVKSIKHLIAEREKEQDEWAANIQASHNAVIRLKEKLALHERAIANLKELT